MPKLNVSLTIATALVLVICHQFALAQDKASTSLMNHAAKGEHIKDAQITVRKAGKEQQEYLNSTAKDTGAVGGSHVKAGWDLKKNEKARQSGSSGKANMQDISVTKYNDKASPKLTTTNNTGLKSNINDTTTSGMKR